MEGRKLRELPAKNNHNTEQYCSNLKEKKDSIGNLCHLILLKVKFQWNLEFVLVKILEDFLREVKGVLPRCEISGMVKEITSPSS